MVYIIISLIIALMKLCFFYSLSLLDPAVEILKMAEGFDHPKRFLLWTTISYSVARFRPVRVNTLL